jgi:hypothetical protein
MAQTENGDGNGMRKDRDASPCFDKYRADWPARSANLELQKFDDEVEDLSGNLEAFSVSKAPAFGIALAAGDAQEGHALRDETKYLWLIRTEDVKLAMENGPLGKSTKRRRLAHTNLSGLSDAHCGGELSFKSDDTICLNGGSSRFQATCEQELSAAAAAFSIAGYHVCNFGWRPDNDRPARVFRELDAKWIQPTGSTT